ncbi:MAG: hypothetical protein V1704_03435 [Candidatus Vogelbacteria bacterium]
MLQNKNKMLVGLVIVLIIVLAVVLFKDKIETNKDNYSVVYLTTGEVYVGKLSTFPDLELSNFYLLQISKDEKDPTKSNFQLNPIKDALWAPMSLHLVKNNVVFYGPLSPDSKIAQTLTTQVK